MIGRPPNPPLFPSPPLSHSPFGLPPRPRRDHRGCGPGSPSRIREARLPQISGSPFSAFRSARVSRSEEHTSELQSRLHLVCRLLLEKKKKKHPLIID